MHVLERVARHIAGIADSEVVAKVHVVLGVHHGAHAAEEAAESVGAALCTRAAAVADAAFVGGEANNHEGPILGSC